MANLRLIIQSSDPASVLTAQLNALPKAGSRLDFVKDQINYIRSGQRRGSVTYIRASDTAASGTAQCQTVIEDDTLTVGAKVLTAKDAPSTADEFLVGANDAETATNLANCINANTGLNSFLSATAVSDTVTMTCIEAGVQGNNLPLSSSGSTIVVSGSFFSGGTDSVLIKEVL